MTKNSHDKDLSDHRFVCTVCGMNCMYIMHEGVSIDRHGDHLGMTDSSLTI